MADKRLDQLPLRTSVIFGNKLAFRYTKRKHNH